MYFVQRTETDSAALKTGCSVVHPKWNGRGGQEQLSQSNLPQPLLPVPCCREWAPLVTVQSSGRGGRQGELPSLHFWVPLKLTNFCAGWAALTWQLEHAPEREECSDPFGRGEKWLCSLLSVSALNYTENGKQHRDCVVQESDTGIIFLNRIF